MQITQIDITHFRGIQELHWTPIGGYSCLAGHGDGTKTTILDAIEIALTDRYYWPISEKDFFSFDTSTPVIIDVTVAGLPAQLLQESEFGLFLRGWRFENSALHDEPEDADVPVITVRFSVDESLEPSWRVITSRDPEGKPISARNRAFLGMVRLGEDMDRHLSWGRGSALTRSTESIAGVRQVLGQAYAKAREIFSEADLTHLRKAAKEAQDAGVQMGAVVREDYTPSLVQSQTTQPSGLLGLSEGRIPLASAGLGTRRLVALGLQVAAVPDGAILLIDEIEYGLEPHRLRHLLRTLRTSAPKGQVFFTTHSAVTLIEANVVDLAFVRTQSGRTSVTSLGEDLQALIRSVPEAILGLRVLVCEGRTELGLCRGLETFWQDRHGGIPLTHRGVVPVSGDGSNAKARAESLAALGLRVALFLDSDDPTLDLSDEWKTTHHVSVFHWHDGLCTEERLAKDFVRDDFLAFATIALRQIGDDSVCARTAQELGLPSPLSPDPSDWFTLDTADADIRSAFARAAKKHSWFKNIECGIMLGELIASSFERLTASPTGTTLSCVEQWLYE